MLGLPLINQPCQCAANAPAPQVSVWRPKGKLLRAPVPPDQAEAEKRHLFAVRANSILAFVECDEALRPKLRDAIVEAMLWAQSQPK
jgi:hypothetical protein